MVLSDTVPYLRGKIAYKAYIRNNNKEHIMSKNERNVNLDHHIPSASLLSYSDYNRVPKSEEAQLHKKVNLEYRDFLPDGSGLDIWERLRKPEFQRATNSWDDDKI